MKMSSASVIFVARSLSAAAGNRALVSAELAPVRHLSSIPHGLRHVLTGAFIPPASSYREVRCGQLRVTGEFSRVARFSVRLRSHYSSSKVATTLLILHCFHVPFVIRSSH